jgi:hypothetical protein
MAREPVARRRVAWERAVPEAVGRRVLVGKRVRRDAAAVAAKEARRRRELIRQHNGSGRVVDVRHAGRHSTAHEGHARVQRDAPDRNEPRRRTTQYGRRRVVDITGGTVTGSRVDATVLTGGFEFELTLSNGSVELEQIDVLRASDGTLVYMRSCGSRRRARPRCASSPTSRSPRRVPSPGSTPENGRERA